ncbi:PQQ-binding-like beta-propeller repeat protein, partial [bacterium]|nr:PQQ-binding-like beta-propeller repeat protein [bacterium]
MTKKKHIFGYVVLLGLAVSSLVSGQDRPSGSDTLWKPPGYAGKAPSSGARVLEKPSHGAQVFNGTRLTTSTEYRDRFETAWSPDNKWVAYGEEGEIYIVPVTGGGPINITANIDGWCSIPSFSPDGLEVIFSRYDGSEWTTYEIDAVNIKEKSLRLVLDLAVEGVLSHSGTYLACRALTGELVIYNTTNGDIKVINADDSSFGLLTFSPDDMFIVTSIANQDGISNLYRIPRDGGAAVQLTFNFFDTGYPEYSPNGKSIMYTGFPDIGRLYLYDFATGGSKQMFPEWEQEHICGSWSPEGKFISYLLDVDGTFEVFRILLPGNEPITQGGLADSAWPMSGQNLHHTGRGIASVAASSTLKWKFQTGREIYSAPTIGVDGTVYVGSNDTYLYAVKPDGMLKWKFQTGGDIASSPAIGADGTVYAGAWATDTYLYAVKSDGTLKWKFQTGGDITSSPAIGPDGTVYVGSGDKYLYAVNPDGTLKWKFQTGGGVGSPAIGPDGTVYAGSMDTYLYAITSEGTLKWKFWCVSGVSSSPAIDFDGTVYVGSSDRNLYAVNPDGTLKWKYQVGNYVYSPSIGSDGTVYVGSLDKYLYAVKPDGTLKWKFQTGGVVLSSPAIGSGGIVYIGSEDKYLYAVKPDGTLKWKFQTGAEVASSPAIDSDGTVYVGSKDGYLYAFAPEIPGAGTITVTSPNGGEFFFAGQTVPITWETSGVSELYLEYSTDNGANWTMIEGGVNAGAKSYAWTVPDASSKTCLVRISNSYDMSIQDVSNAAFTIRSPYLRIVTPNSAESWVIGSTQIITWEARDVAAITIELSVDNGAAWTLIAKNVDAMKKSYSWTIPNNPSDKCRVRITDESGSGIISSSYSAFTIKAAEQPVASVRVIAPNGGEVWTAGKAYKITWQSSNVKTVAIAYTSNDGTTWTVIATGVDATAAAYEWIIPDSPSTACRVRVIDESNSGVLGRSYANFTIVAPTGGLADSAWPMKGQNLQHTGRGIATVAASNTVKWKYRTGGNIFESSPVIGSDGTVYVESNDSYLNAVKSDGTLKWKFQTGQAGMSAGYASPAIGADGTVYVGSEDKYLYAVTSDGTLKWKFQAGGSLYASSPAIGSDGTVYVGSIDGYLYAVTSGGTLKWKFQTGNSIASSPAIGSDGTVYFGSGDGYLYAVTSDGTLKWKYQTGGQVQSSAAIGSDGTVYVGSHVWGSGSNTYLYAVKSDGTLKWKYQTGGQDWSSPAIGTDGTVYVGSWDTYLYALKSDGTLKWKYQTGGQVNSSPAIGTDGTVYFGSDDTNLYAVKSDGTLKWKYQFEGSIQ